MSDSIDAQPGGRLLALPQELRLLIYEQLFPPCKVDIHAPRTNSWVDDNDHHITRVDVALLTTCRTIHAEATPILYANTEFYITFACSGPDTHSMKIGKHQFYAQLLHDLHGRVRSLFRQARKISLSIFFTDTRVWEKAEGKWFRQLTSELARLGKAPKLKQLHITFEADDCYLPAGSASYLYPTISDESNVVLGVLGDFETRAAVTTAIHPSLVNTDVDLSTYLDTLSKLQWTDTTHEVYSKTLARLSSRHSYLEQEIRRNREWVASQNPAYLEEFDNNRRFLSYLDMDDLVQIAQSAHGSLDVALAEIQRWEPELEALYRETTLIEAHLEWVAEERSAHAKAA